MNKEELLRLWLAEEDSAHIHGWDFSHIHARYNEEKDLPWDYEKIIRAHLEPHDRLLDLDTGGGEFLLSLGHPYALTSATDAYSPNVALCEATLSPIGIDFREAAADGSLPFDDASFDVIINRHGQFNVAELHRILKPGGVFITQQVGAENDRELVSLLLGDTELPFPDLYLSKMSGIFSDAGFDITDSGEAFSPIRFYDVGALVWFARIIEWEFVGFSVESCLDRLYAAEELLEQKGCIEGRIHRFYLVAKKAIIS